MIWEHRWNLTSVEAFRERHVVPVPIRQQATNETGRGPQEYQHYFNGAGNCHQGMFMATTWQLRAWEKRAPKCDFRNSPWKLPMHLHREKVSSLQLFWKGGRGCNVTQIIPMERHQDFLIHHMSNKQWHSHWKTVRRTNPKSFRRNPLFPIEEKQLAKAIKEFQQHEQLRIADALREGQANPKDQIPKQQLSTALQQRIYIVDGEMNATSHERHR